MDAHPSQKCGPPGSHKPSSVRRARLSLPNNFDHGGYEQHP